jgi:tetratricopeptide (TPR) repeat protein
VAGGDAFALGVALAAGAALLAWAAPRARAGLRMQRAFHDAMDLWSEEDVAGAEARLEVALRDMPRERCGAWAGMLSKVGWKSAAMRLIAEAVEASPDDIGLLRQLVTIFESADKAREALPRVEAFRARRPADPWAERLFADAALAAGDFARAAPAYEACLAREPEALDLAASYAETLIGLGRADEAAGLIRAALERSARFDFRRTGADYLNRQRRRLMDLDNLVARSAGAGQASIDAAAATGLLNPRAGGSYKLVGYSKLLASTVKPARVAVPPQTDLDDADGLWLLREGRIEEAVGAFKATLDADLEAWPALIGLGASMNADRFPPHERLKAAVRSAAAVPRIGEVVACWAALTVYERGYASLCLALAFAIPRILAAGGRVHIVALEAKITDLPEFADTAGSIVKEPEDRRRRDAIGGLASGAHSATRIEELYEVAPASGWTLAHEFGHQVWNVMTDAERAPFRALFEKFGELGYVAKAYALRNEHEFFACGYERFAMRLALRDFPFEGEHDADREHGLDAAFSALAGAK